MGRTADELGRALSAAEMAEWVAYFELEPWGEHRMDLRFGMLGSIILNLFRERGKRPVEPADLCPDFAGDRRRGADLREMGPGEVRALAGAMAEALQGGAEASGG